ncbi:MAG TPA: ASKHA domain-containing protein [Bryobacteraceae bacterium]|nr:ASKHA domain-containing protein [Bryobacteraceae bacterium]
MACVASGGQRCRSVAGRTLFETADRLGVRVPTSCGRQASCHECIVDVTRGMEGLAPRTGPEGFLRGSYRLACQAAVVDDTVDIEFAPLSRRPKILTTSVAVESDIDPIVTRRGGSVYYDGEPIDEDRGRLCGLAVDWGTTTVVLELADLETGAGLWMSSFENPQRFGGSDVMNRISYDAGPAHGELHKAAISALNREIKEMCRSLSLDRRQLYEVVVVGNATMRDLFFGLDVQSIGQRPYKSQVERDYLENRRPGTTLLELSHRLGLLAHPKARIYGGPLIASHVGADTAADLLATGMYASTETAMLVDVGTNTEVVVAHRGRLVAASCPAGPAFEGGLVTYGMTGCDGAIEELTLNGGGWKYRTIGDVPPRGICGSGLIDLLAGLRRAGIMAPKGMFANRAGVLPIVPEEGITFSREDASNLAQAKAANYCGQYIVLRHCGVRPADLGRLYLAGGFANYINVRNAAEIGFLAPVPEERIVKAGNASLSGARQMLLSRRKRRKIEEVARRVEHIELETTPDFFEVFVEACQFKPMPCEF